MVGRADRLFLGVTANALPGSAAPRSAFALTLGGGTGYGGKILAALPDPRGEQLDPVEAQHHGEHRPVWGDMTKSRLIREFHLYWHSLAGGAVPERSQFDPIAVPQAIPSLMVVEYNPTTDRLRYRLSGTLADEHTGFKLTGCYLDDMFESHTGKAVRFFDTIYRRVLKSGVPEEGTYHWPSPRGLQLNITFGVFPLLVDGAVRQFICVEDYTELYGGDPDRSWSSGPFAAP